MILKELLNINKTVVEDTTQEVAALQAQLAILNVKRVNATKAIDNQIRMIQQQIAVKTKQTANQPHPAAQPGVIQNTHI